MIAATDTEAVAAVTLPLWLSLGAMCINGAFGAAVARSRFAPVFGVMLAGVVVGLGGGMVRDVLLNTEPVAIKEAVYIPAVLIASLLGALFLSRHMRKKEIYILTQGLALGLLVTVGAQRALEFDTPFFAVVLLAVVTASAGGTITDMLTEHRAALFSQAHWLGLALTIGAIVFIPLSLYVNYYLAVIVAVAVVASLRFFSVHRDWPSLSFPGEIAAAAASKSSATAQPSTPAAAPPPDDKES